MGKFIALSVSVSIHQNGEIHRRLRWERHVGRMEGCWCSLKTLIGRRTGRRPLVNHRRRKKENIGIDLTEIGVNLKN